MTVADLQRVLQQVGRMVEAAGAKAGASAELDGFAAALDRFKERPLKGFAELVGRMDESGAVAPKSGKTKAAPARVPAADPQALAGEVRLLYDRAADPATTEAEVTALSERLGGLTIPGLKQVAAAIGFTVPSKLKTKVDIVGGIRHRIMDRRGASIRSQLGDRPSGVPTDPARPATGQPSSAPAG